MELLNCIDLQLCSSFARSVAGVGIVSPRWVLQSLRSGKQQRCLTVSADASRHLPSAAAASGSILASNSGHAGSQACSHAGSDGAQQQRHQQGLSSELLSSKAARQHMLGQLAGGSAGGEAAGGGAVFGPSGAAANGVPSAAHQLAATPAELLTGVLWSVLDPPAAARLERRQRPAEEPADEE